MDELADLYSRQMQQIEDLNAALVLINQKTNSFELLLQMRDKTVEQKKLVAECRTAIDEYHNELAAQYKKLLEQSQEIQLDMLHILSVLNEKEKSCIIVGGYVARQSSAKKYMYSSNKENGSQTLNYQSGSTGKPTCRMLLSEYKDSPFARRKQSVAVIEFTDFEASIDRQTFNKIPAYMKGRETLEELNSFLHNTIIRCLTEKYTLAGKQRQVITNQHDILLWKLYDSQMAYFPGKKFITQGDLSTMNRKIIDKKTLSRIQMLRHIQILREERKNSTICYIWLQ